MENLSDKDRLRLVKFYEDALAKYGPESPRGVHWLNLHNQLARFDTLCKVGDLSHKTVLDVGCGVGDLYDFLAHNFTSFHYLGIDIVPLMITRARIKFPHGLFEERDIFSFNPESDSFDYVLASGAMTFNVSQGKKYYYEMIEQMFKISRRGAACNFLHEDYTKGDTEFLVYSPQEIAQVAAKITKNYKVIMGYIEGDFTLHLLK